MKIYTKTFVENVKLLSSVIQKAHQIHESVYFNFQDSYAYFSNPNTNLRISFMYEKEENEVVENFLVSYEKFQIICNLYDYLEFKDGVFFRGEESYDFSTFKDDYDISNFKDFDNLATYTILDNEFTSNLPKALKYCGEEIPTLAACFIRNNKLLSTDKRKFYECNLKGEYDNSDFPIPLCKILVQNSENEIKFSTTENKLLFKIGEHIDLISAKVKDLSAPDTSSENFIKAYDHPYYLTVDRKPLIDSLSLLQNFVKDAPSNRILIELKSNEITLNVRDGSKITKVVPIKEISNELVGTNFWISQANLKNTISEFTSQTVTIKMKAESPIINFFEDESKHIILVKIKEE